MNLTLFNDPTEIMYYSCSIKIILHCKLWSILVNDVAWPYFTSTLIAFCLRSDKMHLFFSNWFVLTTICHPNEFLEINMSVRYASFQLLIWNMSCIYIVSWEAEGRYCSLKMFHWELEGRYRCTMYRAIAPFWFSTEHLYLAVTPFWCSTDDQGHTFT